MDFVSHDFIQQILRDSWYTNEKTGGSKDIRIVNVYNIIF